MTQGPAATPIDWNTIGNPQCDANSQRAVMQAMGLLDAQGTPIPNVRPDFSQIVTQIPQLLSRDANGRSVWNPALDIVTIRPDRTGREQITAQTRDGVFHTVEIEAAVIAAAQVARRHGIAIKDVPIQEIRQQMTAPLGEIMENARAPTTGVPPSRR